MRFCLILFLFLLVLQAQQALAVELNIRNEESSKARVALAYLQGDWLVVEGWLVLAPDQILTIALHKVEESDIYIYVEFENAEIKQFIANAWKVECMVPDENFRYSLMSLGGKPGPNGPDMRKAPFQNIDMVYKNKNEQDKLWFVLSTSAG